MTFSEYLDDYRRAIEGHPTAGEALPISAWAHQRRQRLDSLDFAREWRLNVTEHCARVRTVLNTPRTNSPKQFEREVRELLRVLGEIND